MSFNKIQKVDIPLARLRKKVEKMLITKIRNEKVDIATDITELKRIVRVYCEQLHSHKLNKLEEIDEFLETYNLLRLNQEEIF